MKQCSILAILWLSICLPSSAQTQQGYVKTKGRLGSNGSVIHGTPLGGATVTVKGRNAVVSGSNGKFSLAIPGNNYYLQNVQKQGYVLTDPDVLSKQYTYSKNQLVLVLEDKAQKEGDKLDALRKIRRTLQRQLEKKENEIEALKAENKLTLQEYQQRLQQLYDEQKGNEQLICDMAERYSKIDYDQVDEFNRRISDYILKGELTKADSLLNSCGDLNTQVAEQIVKGQVIQKEKKKVEKAESVHQRENNDLASRCYAKYEIFKMQHRNDSAAYYLALRVSLDTTRVDWLLETGNFEINYLANYSLGLNYYQKALSCAQKNGADKKVLQECYNNLGIAYNFMGNNTVAMDYYQRCLESCDGDSLGMCIVLRNIGNVFYDKSNYDEALAYYKKALAIRETLREDTKEGVALLYESIGNTYSDIGNFNLAKDFFDKSYELIKREKGEHCSEIAGCLLYMGYNYNELHENDKAMDCFKKALGIFIEMYGENHPHVAVAYGGLGSTCGGKKDYINQLKYSGLALEIKKRIYGEKHASIAISLNNVGMAYMYLKEYNKAIECFLQSLEICRLHYGEKHVGVAVIYRNLGFLHKELEQYDKALDYYLKSLKVAEDLYGETNLEVQFSVNNLGCLYYIMKNYSMAIHYLRRSLDITEKVYSDNKSKLRSAVKIMNKTYEAALEENRSDKQLSKEFDAFKKKYGQFIDD